MQLSLLLLMTVVLGFAESTIYSSEIKKSTKLADRQWDGKISPDGDNFGGWFVRIRSGGRDTISCCGSYFSPILVITSANCINPFRYQIEQANVLTTANDDEEDIFFTMVDMVYVPDDFSPQFTYMDIALVRLTKPLGGVMTEFIQLSNASLDGSHIYSTFGWGFDSLDVQQPTDFPKITEIELIKTKDCIKEFDQDFLSDTVLCMKLPEIHEDCVYDGGSPLVWQNFLVGIASVGSTCRNTSIPGIYTDIRTVSKFIWDIRKTILSKRRDE